MVLDFVDADGHATGAAPTLDKRYFQGPGVDQLLSQENVTQSTSSPNRVWWVLPDHLGSTRDLVTGGGTGAAVGSVVAHFQYDSFGVLLDGRENVTRYQFTGRESDSNTDLNYHRARWYDPLTGKFTSEDPITFAARDPNITRYVGNGVLNATDPSGLWEVNRRGRARAVAVPTDGDTIRQLAWILRLNADEYKSWLRTSDDMYLNIDEPICGGLRTYTVPNIVGVYHAKRSWKDISLAVTTNLMNSETEIFYELEFGYKVRVVRDGVSRDAFKRLFKDPDVFRFRFVGHGGRDGLLVDVDQHRSVSPFDASRPYKLAKLQLWACLSSRPDIAPSGRKAYWRGFVSDLGEFEGSDWWAFTPDDFTPEHGPGPKE